MPIIYTHGNLLKCVNDKRPTPNVEGSERIVITKNGGKMLKARCAVCGIIKNRFLPGN